MSEPTLPKPWIDANRDDTRPDPDRRHCPDAALLAQLAVDPAGSDPELLEHVAACSACSDELQRVLDDGTLAALTEDLIEDLTEDGATPLDGPSRSGTAPRGWSRGALGGLALAASLVIAVALTLFLQPIDETPTLRGGPAIEGLHPSSGARLEQAPAYFEWPAGGGLEELVLMDERADILWTAPATRDGRMAVPEGIREALNEGRHYWQVRDLERDAVLGPFEFRLERP
jgi:hypothetical protein